MAVKNGRTVFLNDEAEVLLMELYVRRLKRGGSKAKASLGGIINEGMELLKRQEDRLDGMEGEVYE